MVKSFVCVSAMFLVALTSASAATVGTTSPVLTAQDQCASCAMWITRYPGPKGVMVLADQSQEKFCSARGMVCGYLQSSAEKQKGITALWVHDAGRSDWKKPSDATMIDAKKAIYVYGSKMKAVMGPSLAPFADELSAKKFQKEYGGVIYRFEDLTKEILGCKQRN